MIPTYINSSTGKRFTNDPFHIRAPTLYLKHQCLKGSALQFCRQSCHIFVLQRQSSSLRSDLPHGTQQDLQYDTPHDVATNSAVTKSYVVIKCKKKLFAMNMKTVVVQ